MPLSTLGPWRNQKAALEAELRAHMIGAAGLDVCSESPSGNCPRVPDAEYRLRRQKALTADATAAALRIARALENDGRPLSRFWPDLEAASRAVRRLLHPDFKPTSLPPFLQDLNRIVIDEVQDFTPIEALLPILLTARLGTAPFLLFAGDESQTVRPTDFEWAWLKNLIQTHLNDVVPEETRLEHSLRCPPKLAELVNRSGTLYSNIRKFDRPHKLTVDSIASSDEDGRIIHCVANAADSLHDLLDLLWKQGTATAIALSRDAFHLSAAEASVVLSPDEAKGLEFTLVCLLNPATHVAEIAGTISKGDTSWAIELVEKRTAIDRFRVAVSRSSETMVFLDVAPSVSALQSLVQVLGQSYEETDVPALLAYLEEEALDIQDRIQRYLDDAREVADARPSRAWDRLCDCWKLLGQLGDTDSEAVLREVCQAVAERGWSYASDRPTGLQQDWSEARLLERTIAAARRIGLVPEATLFAQIREHGLADSEYRPIALESILATLAKEGEWKSWVLQGLRARRRSFYEELEAFVRLADHAAGIAAHIERLCQIVEPPRELVESAVTRFRRTAAETLMNVKRFHEAIRVLRPLGSGGLDLLAQCLEESGEYAEGAECYAGLDQCPEALRCYRLARKPDGALALLARLDALPECADELGLLAQVLDGDRRCLEATRIRHRLLNAPWPPELPFPDLASSRAPLHEALIDTISTRLRMDGRTASEQLRPH